MWRPRAQPRQLQDLEQIIKQPDPCFEHDRGAFREDFSKRRMTRGGDRLSSSSFPKSPGEVYDVLHPAVEATRAYAPTEL